MSRIQFSRAPKRIDRWGFLSARWPEVLAGALAGLLVGFALLVLGPTSAALIPLAVVFVFVLFKAPEFAVLLVLLLTSGLLPAQYNPSINLFVGHFQVSDLALISLLAVAGVRLLAERRFRLRPTLLYLPLVLFCLAIVGGMVTAVVVHGIPFSHTTYEARILLYYSLFFATVNLIRTRQQAFRLVYGILSIGILIALLIIGQIILGFSIPIILPAYFKTDLLMRAYHPGFITIYMTMIILICSLAFNIRPLRKVVIWVVVLILALANTISLGRNIVVSSLLAMTILLFLLSTTQRRVWIRNMSILFILAIGSFGILHFLTPSATVLAYPGALIQRLTHFFTVSPLSPDETMLWRVEEAGYAWEHISHNPIFGIGFSVNYRPAFSQTDTLQRFIHNGYLWVWLKTGLIGLIPFIWFLVTFLVRGFQNWAMVEDDLLRAAALGFTLVIFAIMVSDFLAPLLVENFNLAFFAAGMGVIEAIFALE